MIWIPSVGGFGPQIFCDYCGRRIEDAEDGNAEWVWGEEEHPSAEVFFTHKRCSDPFRALRSDVTMASELTAWLIYLGNNVEFDRTDAEAQVAGLAQWGF